MIDEIEAKENRYTLSRFLVLDILKVVLAISFVTANFSCALAQTNDDTRYIVASSFSTLRNAEKAASKYIGRFPDTEIYATKSGYFAVVVARIGAAFANSAIQRQAEVNHIPADSYVSSGTSFLERVWQSPKQIQKGDSFIVDAIATERNWSKATKEGVQNALVWSGDYTATIDGDFGRGTRSAIKSFQLRNGYYPTGYLTVTEITALESIRKAVVERIGYDIVREIDTGIEIGFAQNIFSRWTPTISDSGYFKSFDSLPSQPPASMTLVSHELRSDSLRLLYDILLDSAVNIASTYHVLKDDWFAVSLDNGSFRTYAYVREFSGAVKGFIITWHKEKEDVFAPLSVAMFNSIRSIPGANLERFVKRQSPKDAVPDETSPAIGVPDSPTKEPRGSYFGTGFYVDALGTIVTNEHVVSECAEIRVAGERSATLVAKDERRDLAVLLDSAMPAKSNFARLSAYPAQLNSDVTAIGFPLQGILSGLNVTRGSVSGEYGIGGSPDELQVTAPVQPGNSGGPLVNQAGDIVGVVSSKLNATKVADAIGDIPQNVNFAIRGQTLQTFLSQNGVSFTLVLEGDALSHVELAKRAREYTVFIECLN